MLVQRDLTAGPYSEHCWTGRKVLCSTMELLNLQQMGREPPLDRKPLDPKLDAKKTNYSFASTSLPPAARAWAYKLDPATGHSQLGPQTWSRRCREVEGVPHFPGQLYTALCSHHFSSLVLQPFWQFCQIRCSKFSALTELFCCLQ